MKASFHTDNSVSVKPRTSQENMAAMRTPCCKCDGTDGRMDGRINMSEGARDDLIYRDASALKKRERYLSHLHGFKDTNTSLADDSVRPSRKFVHTIAVNSTCDNRLGRESLPRRCMPQSHISDFHPSGCWPHHP